MIFKLFKRLFEILIIDLSPAEKKTAWQKFIELVGVIKPDINVEQK